jgi:hypothetical protein
MFSFERLWPKGGIYWFNVEGDGTAIGLLFGEQRRLN